MLARTPALDPQVINTLKQQASSLGFTVNEMINVTNETQE
ncbi:MAG: hypothetical protein ACKODT_05935 [Fluviibacter sp.]